MAEAVKISTPIGDLYWVIISGKGKKNYNEDGYEYAASVVLSKKDAEPLLKSIDDLYKNDHKEGCKVKSLGYKICSSDGKSVENDSDGTHLSFNFKTRTKFLDDKPKKITVFNSKAQKVELGDIRIGNGSKGAISGIMKHYINGKVDGVSLWLNAVQISVLNEYSEDSGFEETKGSFEGLKDEDTGFTSVAEENPSKVTTNKEGVSLSPARPRL